MRSKILKKTPQKNCKLSKKSPKKGRVKMCFVLFSLFFGKLGQHKIGTWYVSDKEFASELSRVSLSSINLSAIPAEAPDM